MRIKNRILSMLLAVLMVLGVAGSAFADIGDTAEQRTTNVHIRKLELTEAKGPVDHNLGKLENTDINNKLQLGGVDKVIGLNDVIFSYVKLANEDDYNKVTVAKPKDLAELNAVGSLSKTYQSTEEIALKPTAKINGETGQTGAGAEDGWVIQKLEDGYYWFFEQKRPTSVTQAIAVPFGLTLPYQNLEGVKDDGKPVGPGEKSPAGSVTMTDIYIYPKNVTSKDKIDKGFAESKELLDALNSKKLAEWKAIYGADYDKYKSDKEKIDALIGSKVEFETKTFLNKGKIFEHVSWTDIMTDGLEYVNGSLKITATVKKSSEETKTITIGTDLEVTPLGTDPNYYGFDVKDKDEFVKTKLNKWLEEGDVEFSFKYKAKITKLNVVDNPESNNISFTPGEPNHNENKTTPKNGEVEVAKSWADGKVPDGILVTYNLIDKTDNKVVATVTLKGKNTIQSKSVDKGMDVVTLDDYKVKFTGLKADHEYTVEEFAEGYKPEYQAPDAANDGKIKIKNNTSPDSLHPTPPQIVTGGKKFVKTDEAGTKRLAGAKFYVLNEAENKYLAIDKNAATAAVEAYNVAEKKYNQAIDDFNAEAAKEGYSETNVQITVDGVAVVGKTDIEAKITELKKDRDEKFVDARAGYVWKSEGDLATKEEIEAGNTNNKPVAVVLTSDEKGRFEITGLAYGKYKLKEFVAPAGYALLQESVPFTIDENSYTNHADGIQYNPNEDTTATDKTSMAQKVINKKVTIPQTGGIGTVIFVVVGLAIMGGAVFAMKKRNAEER